MKSEKLKVEGYISPILIIVIGFIAGIGVSIYLNKAVPVAQETCEAKEHVSYFSDKTFFNKAYSLIPGDIKEEDEKDKEIKGVIVNHHLLAAGLIAEEMEAIATNDLVTVILLAPNHFFAGKGNIIASEYDWNTPYGVLESDCNSIKKLEKIGAANIEEQPFEKEHGISGIVPFIKKSLPNAKVIPIIFKDNTKQEEIEVFVNSLYEITGEDALMVGSFDFSHYVLPQVAKKQDERSIEIIKAFDYTNIADVEIDSRPGLSAQLQFMEKIHANKFNLVKNMNSADITKLENSTETTSYITGFFYK